VRVRTKGASLGENADGERLQELKLSHDAVAAAAETIASAARSDGELVEQHRVLALQDLRVCVAVVVTSVSAQLSATPSDLEPSARRRYR
jgi:hypothetical protein